eukprot:CAMPEP_0174700544 /NCGR_PEP_ID=MMETSP1094-20130205/5468_1 /TAXON_ID=156173 /ORGANISM="Chrysochromulina brevifilum, Strain UTEX LB 985" /LENGTH=477 /DNA_ID=CAMNT_0015898047 /DNA_START=144 /DNA_END=1577 /DNA_ORIENTATION=+
MILISSIYCLVYYQSEADRNTAYAPKLAVVLGLTLTCLLVLMLPLDVANRNANGGLAMETLWLIMYLSIAGMCVGVVPFMMFYYEAWDPESKNWQVWTAIKYETLTILVVGTVLVLMWLFLGYAEVPIEEFSYNSTFLVQLNRSTNESEVQLLPPADHSTVCSLLDPCAHEGVEKSIELSVTVPVYIIALVAFVGWFFFTVFVGVGLVALPMDLLREYKTYANQEVNLEDYAKQRMLLNERAKKLQELGMKLGPEAHRRRDGKSIKRFNQFKQAVYFLERDWRKIKIAYKEKGGNPLRWMCQAVCGMLASIISIAWYVHILLYIFVSPPPTTFLNEFFSILDGVFPLFGVLAYGLFSFYLLLCVLKGCMKVGLRFFWIPIHPMRIGETMMNSFLFNVWLLLLCAVATVQFCFSAFQSYAQLTAIELLLGVQVRNLKFLSIFFHNQIFFYCMAAISAITLVALCICPNDKPALDDDDF